MEELQKLLSDTYYTLVVMVALQIVTTIIGIMNRKKFVELKYFHFYSMAGLFQTIITIVSLLFFNQELKSKLIEFSVNIFLLIEFLLIYHLFFQIILIKKLRNILKLFFVSFLIYVVFMWYFTDAFYKRSPKLFPIETVVILFPTVLFFLQLFKLPATCNLFNQPAFWINIGILIAFTCTLPLYTLDVYLPKFIDNNFYFYYINFIAYSILFTLICRAYLCKIEQVSIDESKR